MNLKNDVNILHISYVDEIKGGGLREAVPKHLEYQKKYANVALLNCNDSELEEADGKYDVYLLSKFKKIINLPNPFNKPDLVVFHAIYFPQYIKLYKECLKLNIPYIVVPHGSLSKEAQKKKMYKKIPANILLFNGFVNNATAIQFLIDGEKKNSRKVKKYIISGNGIELSKIVKTYDNENIFKKFIYIGRYDVRIKGLDLLIKAVSLIKDELIDKGYKVELYGTNDKGKNEIRKLINKYKLDNVVILNGSIFGEEKLKKLLSSDIFLQISRTEGQPLGIMEAMSLGIPCIISMKTNYGEVVKDNNIGWVTDLNIEDISKNMLKAIENSKMWNKMSKNGINYARSNFDWDCVAKNTINKYLDIIDDYKEEL